MHTPPAPVTYQVSLHNLHAHLYQVTVTVQQPCARQRLSLPVWIPGSYLVREFSKNLQHLQATQAGRELPVRQHDKHTWDINCTDNGPLELTYEVCAYDASVRTAWLDAQRGFFNGTSLLLRVHGQEARPHHLYVLPSPQRPGWQLATGLPPVATDAQGFGLYAASDYDELVDSPVEMGNFWSADFTACGVQHRFVIAGAPPSLDGERLIRDTQTICEVIIRFWHPDRVVPEHGRKAPYVFMLNATHDGYGGLEHSNSTALVCARSDLPRHDMGTLASEQYITLLGLISHEYFHTWNVKRLRPAELTPYDYDRENYTQLLWFFEGLTSYYDDLLLRRAGLIDDATYLKLLAKTLNGIRQTPGRHVQSVAQASFDAWVKYYRQDENTPNATISYYTKGAFVGLCLDLSLRHAGQTTLDDVMRSLWTRCVASQAADAPQRGAMTQDDLLAVLQDLTGQSWEPTLQAWVHGTQDLPVIALLEHFGVQAVRELLPPSQLWGQQLGLRVQETSGSIQIRQVLRGGLAEQAGMMPGDEWLGIELERAGHSIQGWRLTRLEDLPLYAGNANTVTALIARDRQLLRLPLRLHDPAPDALDRYQLIVSTPTLLTPWLHTASV